MDPLFQSYPWYTPYQFAGNNPIWAIDRDGLEEEKVNPDQQRADAGKEVIKNYQETGTTYSQPKREIGLNVKCADCSSTTTTILQQAGQGDLFKTNYTGSGSGDGIQGEIRKKEGAENLKDPYRKTDPKVGDIMMWKGHIAIVTDVTDSRVKWANMGVSSKAGIRTAKTTSAETIEQGAEVYSSDFWGFWTPPNSKGDGTKPVISKSTGGDVAQQAVQQQEVNMANTANSSSASPINQNSSSSFNSWWSGVKSDWNQFWSDFIREANDPDSWTGQ